LPFTFSDQADDQLGAFLDRINEEDLPACILNDEVIPFSVNCHNELPRPHEKVRLELTRLAGVKQADTKATARRVSTQALLRLIDRLSERLLEGIKVTVSFVDCVPELDELRLVNGDAADDIRMIKRVLNDLRMIDVRLYDPHRSIPDVMCGSAVVLDHHVKF